jgi:uncharacterized protein (TIGR02145 family)
MKKLNLLIVFCLVISTYSQAQIPPQAFNYSAVARNAAGVPIATSTIGIQVSILKTSTLGPVQYSENHFVNTDAYGLFNLIIGAGAVQSGSISTINWSADNYYLKVGMDVTGGTNFLTMGTTQLLSVPYALHAATADSVIGGAAGFSGNYNDLTNQPNLAPVATSGDYSDLINVPSLSPLATSGDYNDILNQPITVSSISASGDTLYLSNGQFFHVISSGFSGNYNDLSNAPILSTVASSGDYNDLINLPVTISSISTSGDTLYLSNGQTFINSASFSGDYNDLTNQPANVSAFNNDAGYITTLNDDDPTNEIQQLSVSATGDTLHLQNGGHVIIPGISAANSPAQVALINTATIGSITSSSAISGGNISNDGGANITDRGICWSTNPNPTISNNTTNDGIGTGSYTSNLTGLTANTTYYVRAYATNSAGTAYGNQVSFTTNSSGGGSIVTNPGAGVTFDGYTYSSIVLGNGQEWMAENLRTTSYANGDPIPNIADGTQWSNLTTGAWVHYNNDSQYENPYGKLFNGYAVADLRNVCPTGWHVPLNTEWNAFINYLGGDAVAGGKMKSTGTQYWTSPNTDAINESGFSGLPGGNRENGLFFSVGDHAWWWSASQWPPVPTAYSAYPLSYLGGSTFEDALPPDFGAYVRCIKD